MKKIVIIFLISYISLFAIQSKEYYILYNKITLGKISDFSTINKGYLIGESTNGFMNLFTKYENYIIYEDKNKPEVKGDNKYKKDKYLLLSLIKTLTKIQPAYQVFTKDHFKMIVKCNNGKCIYDRINQNDNKSYKGYLTFTNNILDEIYDSQSKISFKRIN